MLEIKRILCPVDFSDFSVWAYRHALSVAVHYRSKLVVLHIVELWRYPFLSFAPTPAAHHEFCQMVHERGKEQLQEFVKTRTDCDDSPELVVQEGMAPDIILSLAQEQKIDVIVMGTHGRRGYDRLTLGSVTDRVMRRAPCPVLVVSRQTEDTPNVREKQRSDHHLSRILLCTDFSENSEKASNYAISATREYDAELTLLHVLGEISNPAKKKQAIAACMEQLDRLIPAEARTTLNVKKAVLFGRPYQQIIQLAKEARIDMVVMGVRGRDALDLAVFGSTTYRVIQLGSCPVLVVRH